MGKRNKKFTLEEAHQIFSSEGYIPLFTDYQGANIPVLVQCPNGHQLKMSLWHFKSGTRCKQCYHDSMRTSEEDIIKKYAEKGLEVIEFPEGYVNWNSKVTFKCSKGHVTTNQVRNFIQSGKECGHKVCSKERRRQTMVERYGVENAYQLPKVIEMTKARPNPMDDPEIVHRQQTRLKSHKLFITPSGRAIHLQGYEPRAYEQLLKEGYTEDEIKTNKEVPRIPYRWKDGTKHKYYPDFYIPKDNLIIEVKSDYFWEYHLEMNLLKKGATIHKGYEYRLMRFE